MLERYLEDFYRCIKEIYIVETNLALLNWDRATALKLEAKEFRAEQISYFSSLYHNLKTNPKLIEIVENLLAHKNQLEEDDYHNLTIFKKDYSKSLKLSSKFVALKAEVCSKAESCWESVKMKSDFKTVESLLQQVFDLVREETELLGYENCAYNALLDNYEPGFTVELGDKLLIPMGKKIAEMLPEIIERQKMDVVEDKRILSMTKAKQRELIDKLAKIIN